LLIDLQYKYLKNFNLTVLYLKYTHVLDIHVSVHRDTVYENDQQDATVMDNLLFHGCSTCFERYIRSSSGAYKLNLQLLILHTYVAAGWYQTLP